MQTPVGGEGSGMPLVVPALVIASTKFARYQLDNEGMGCTLVFSGLINGSGWYSGCFRLKFFLKRQNYQHFQHMI